MTLDIDTRIDETLFPLKKRMDACLVCGMSDVGVMIRVWCGHGVIRGWDGNHWNHELG